MSFHETELLNFYQATVRVLSDKPQNPVDVVFFHNRSYGDDTGLLAITSEVLTEGKARFIAVTNNEGERYSSVIPFEANPGKTEYIRRLRIIGIPDGAIAIPDMKAFNAREENTAFLALAKKEGWTSGAILTQPHQALRTMLGAVQEMNQTGYMMRIFTFTPDQTPWEEIVRGNQGMEEKPRWQHIGDELSRIILRQKTGELATFEELFAYWEERTRGSLRLHRNIPPELQGQISP